MSSRRIAYAGVFIALTVALGYALMVIPNLEMITATVFIAGWLMGPGMGALIGLLSETIYSGLHPLGSGFLFPPLLIAQVATIALVGFIGGLARKGEIFFLANAGGYFGLALVGTMLTLIYDIATSLAYPLAAGFEGVQLWATLIAGLGLGGVHLISNAVIFFLIVPNILKAVHSQLGITGVIR